MNKQLKILSIAALALLGIALTSGKAFAFRGNAASYGPNYLPDRHESMMKAFDANDYQTWKTLMQGRGKVSQTINEKNFSIFAQAHRLMLEGKTQEANKIREELGLGINKYTGGLCSKGTGWKKN